MKVQKTRNKANNKVFSIIYSPKCKRTYSYSAKKKYKTKQKKTPKLLVLGCIEEQEVIKCDLVLRERTYEFKSWLICWLASGRPIGYLGFREQRLGKASWSQWHKTLYNTQCDRSYQVLWDTVSRVWSFQPKTILLWSPLADNGQVTQGDFLKDAAWLGMAAHSPRRWAWPTLSRSCVG